MSLKEDYAARRAAHAGVAQLIKRYWQNLAVGPPGTLGELQRIMDAHLAAGAVEDGPLEAQPLVSQVTPTLAEQKSHTQSKE